MAGLSIGRFCALIFSSSPVCTSLRRTIVLVTTATSTLLPLSLRGYGVIRAGRIDPHRVGAGLGGGVSGQLHRLADLGEVFPEANEFVEDERFGRNMVRLAAVSANMSSVSNCAIRCAAPRGP